MKKLMTLMLTLAMFLALGNTAFAAGWLGEPPLMPGDASDSSWVDMTCYYDEAAYIATLDSPCYIQSPAPPFFDEDAFTAEMPCYVELSAPPIEPPPVTVCTSEPTIDTSDWLEPATPIDGSMDADWGIYPWSSIDLSRLKVLDYYVDPRYGLTVEVGLSSAAKLERIFDELFPSYMLEEQFSQLETFLDADFCGNSVVYSGRKASLHEVLGDIFWNLFRGISDNPVRICESILLNADVMPDEAVEYCGKYLQSIDNITAEMQLMLENLGQKFPDFDDGWTRYARVKNIHSAAEMVLASEEWLLLKSALEPFQGMNHDAYSLSLLFEPEELDWYYADAAAAVANYKPELIDWLESLSFQLYVGYECRDLFYDIMDLPIS